MKYSIFSLLRKNIHSLVNVKKLKRGETRGRYERKVFNNRCTHFSGRSTAVKLIAMDIRGPEVIE